MSAIWFLDPYQATSRSTANSSNPHCQYEVWSILGALEVPYTSQKKLYLPKSYMGYHFCYNFFFVRLPLLGGPLVKFSKIGTIQQPPEGSAKSKIFTHNSGSPHLILASKIIFGAVQTDPDPSGSFGAYFSRFLDPDQSIWLTENFCMLKPYMGSNFCSQHILIGPLLLGAPLINVVLCSKAILNFWIWIRPQGSEKLYLSKSYMGYHFCC